MKKLFWITVVIAILAAFFASTYPDGLDFVAEKLGFAGKVIEHNAPFAGYSIPFIQTGGISTAMAGIAGVLLIMGCFWLCVYAIKRKKII